MSETGFISLDYCEYPPDEMTVRAAEFAVEMVGFGSQRARHFRKCLARDSGSLIYCEDANSRR